MKKSKYIPRPGIDKISSRLLDAVLLHYPETINLSHLSKELNTKNEILEEKLNNLNKMGIPISINKEENNMVLKGDLLEPISWIINTKEFAENTLKLIENEKTNHKNKKKIILTRIYKDYVNMLNDVFDKWNSLRLIEKLND
tara:strand:- start:34 stop:459 length:426 start_codon:yes stop_codon:yes gene_type:complete